MFEKFHAIAVYDAVVILVKSDNGVLGKLIWEVRQYSRAPIIVVIPGSHVVKKYIDWGADLVLCTQTAEKTGEIRSRNSQADSEYQENTTYKVIQVGIHFVCCERSEKYVKTGSL